MPHYGDWPQDMTTKADFDVINDAHSLRVEIPLDPDTRWQQWLYYLEVKDAAGSTKTIKVGRSLANVSATDNIEYIAAAGGQPAKYVVILDSHIAGTTLQFKTLFARSGTNS